MINHLDKHQFNPVTLNGYQFFVQQTFAQPMISFLLFLVPVFYAFESKCESIKHGRNLDNRYIGIPVGTIDDKEAQLKAEVYVSDEHTIGFDKLSHITKDPSCKQ